MRGIARRLRSSFSIGSSRMAIRSQMAWHWRWLLNLLMMAAVAGIVWWLVQNSYRITGFNVEEAKQQLETLNQETRQLKADLDAARGTLIERDRQLQIEKASQTELARSVTQLQEENAATKEDLSFLRKLMSSGATPEGISVSDLKVEREGKSNEYRYRMLLMQGGQRKQDFKGKVQVIVRVQQGTQLTALSFPPDADLRAAGNEVEFRYYQKIDGRFRIPEGAQLKNAQVRLLGLPGYDVRSQKSLNF
jgi:DNA-binding transcriptional MerR regulator